MSDPSYNSCFPGPGRKRLELVQSGLQKPSEDSYGIKECGLA